MLGRRPGAQCYFSDEFSPYGKLICCPDRHEFVRDKSEMYSVKADNAEPRHYLTRLACKSHCFLRCLRALWRAVKLFVFSWTANCTAVPSLAVRRMSLISCVLSFRHS